jgi:hypothetical protein
MDAVPLRPLLADAGRRLRSWGWPFALGAGCLVLAGALAGGWSPALRRESDALADSADAASRRATAARGGDRASSRPLSGRERYAAAFPDADARPARVAALLASAQGHHLRSSRSEFKLSADPELGLLRYVMTMPVSGRYADLREFLSDAQARDPALSLDHLSARRTSADAPSVDAEVTWSLYMRDEAVPGSALR